MGDSSIKAVFDQHLREEKRLRCRSHKERRADLKKLEKALIESKEAIREALHKDFQKPQLQTDYSELYVVLKEIRHASKMLKKWMLPHSVPSGLSMFGARAWVVPEAKGASLVISPWNYPILLSLGPVVSAIAAGCPVILKPSEFTPNSSAFLQKLLTGLFPEKEVAVFLGDANIAKELTALPFRHIFFTGSTRVGQKVMEAAAKNLSSVTLELGGKSPSIVDRTANLKITAKALLFGKWMNAGQTCVASDYVLVEEFIAGKLKDALVDEAHELFKNGLEQKDYCGLIHKAHFEKLEKWIKEARNNGSEVWFDAGDSQESNKMGIKIIASNRSEGELMNTEIFGPILLIRTVKSVDEAIDYINQRPAPLSAYIFSQSKANQRKIIDEVIAGTMSINDVVGHVSHDHLPFGGVHDSGIGKSHGLHGFKAFSHEKAILKRSLPFNWLNLIYPPYSAVKEKIANIVIRYL